MSERNYYVLREDNCKFESMTKEQILAAIEQAVTDGEITNVDTGFVTKLKEQNANAAFKVWVGTQAQYNALTTTDNDCLYLITDDTSKRDVENAISILRSEVNAIYDGSAALGYAQKAANVDGFYKSLDSLEIDIRTATVIDVLNKMSNESFVAYSTMLKLDSTHFDGGTWHVLYKQNSLYASLLSAGNTEIKYVYYRYNSSSKKWEINKITKAAMTEVAL